MVQYLAAAAETLPEPPLNNMGAQILDTIRSGLGLITDLAKEFLSGFTTLFWEAGQGLTQFGTFALVMLGISISFAVIKLVINVVRSNTGA